MKVMQEKYGHLDSYKYWLKWARKHKSPLDFYESLPDNEYYPVYLQYKSDNVFNEGEMKSIDINYKYKNIKYIYIGEFLPMYLILV